MSDDASAPERDGGYDEWLDTLADGEGYALVCPDGHGSLPPRRVCPECGSTELSDESLSETGTVEAHSVIHVPAPSFADDAPYATAVVDLGPTRVTGVYRAGDGSVPDPEVGDRVAVDVGERATDGERLIVFRPATGE